MSVRDFQINIRLSEVEKKALEELARKRGCKTTEVLRELLWDARSAAK